MKNHFWMFLVAGLVSALVLGGCAQDTSEQAENANPSTAPDTAGMSAEDAAKATDASQAAAGDNLAPAGNDKK